MQQYRFSTRSLSKLNGVHPVLVGIVVLALRKYAELDFGVLEGVRSRRRQQDLVKEGQSQTMDSKHLLQNDGFAHAVDLAPWRDGSIPWHDWGAFEQVAESMQDAADELGYGDRLIWGGDWESLKDGPHFQLSGV